MTFLAEIIVDGRSWFKVRAFYCWGQACCPPDTPRAHVIGAEYAPLEG